MSYLITFSDENMTISRSKCAHSALKHGVKQAFEYGPEDISDEFRWFNREIFEHPRGYGYWLWKPYFIYMALNRIEDGEILLYSDAGIEFVGNIQPVIDAMDSDIMLFSNGWTHVHWCKNDVRDLINSVYLGDEIKQVQASNIIIKNSAFARKFIKEWLLYCQFPGLIDDSPSEAPNHPEFREHRHDQAILTCLAIKYGITQHWFPSETNQHKRADFGDRYETVFRHHRKRNDEW